VYILNVIVHNTRRRGTCWKQSQRKREDVVQSLVQPDGVSTVAGVVESPWPQANGVVLVHKDAPMWICERLPFSTSQSDEPDALFGVVSVPGVHGGQSVSPKCLS